MLPIAGPGLGDISPAMRSRAVSEGVNVGRIIGSEPGREERSHCWVNERTRLGLTGPAEGGWVQWVSVVHTGYRREGTLAGLRGVRCRAVDIEDTGTSAAPFV